MLKASGAKLFPWKNWEEWYQVCSDLFSTEHHPTHVLRALSIVSNWRRKMAIPVAIDSAAQLVQLVREENQVVEPVYSLALACAIVRLVNGMVDNLQESSSFAVSVTGLASQLGLPTFVAEMRHDISHNALPCREALYFAANECLEWLKKHYFMAQWEQLGTRNNSENIVSQLESYEGAVEEERKRFIAIQITKHVSDSSVDRLLIPALVSSCLIPKDYRWNASVQARVERWRDALRLFQQRWPFFVCRLYWYLFIKGCKVTDRMPNEKLVSLIFGWLKWIIVEATQWLSSAMERERMSQWIAFSGRIYWEKMQSPCFVQVDHTSIKEWLDMATSKIESTSCKSWWSLLLYDMETKGIELSWIERWEEPPIPEKPCSWTKQEPLYCPIGSIVDGNNANALYRQTTEATEMKNAYDTSCYLSRDLLDRIAQF